MHKDLCFAILTERDLGSIYLFILLQKTGGFAFSICPRQCHYLACLLPLGECLQPLHRDQGVSSTLLLGVTKEGPAGNRGSVKGLTGNSVLSKAWLGAVVPPALELWIQGAPSFAHVAQGGAGALLQAGATALFYLCFSSQNAVKLLWI